jgi:GntR family transcriptional regulator, uxu operon transcriptional repressor
MRPPVAPSVEVPPIASAGPRSRKRSVVLQIRAVIEQQIGEGRLRPGDRILPERDLARQFGASRNVVRSALEELRKAGCITRHVGRGTLVSAAAVSSKFEGLQLSDVSPVELLAFRLAFEPGLAEAIVLNASEDDLGGIRACVKEGDAARVWRQWELCDRAFHQRLIAATHNKLVIAIYAAVLQVRHETPWLVRKRESTDRSKWKAFQLEHCEILDALERRDARAAAMAIRKHLARVRQSMLDH